MQVFMVTGLFAGQHNTKLHGTITGVILFFCSTFPPSSWDQTNTIQWCSTQRAGQNIQPTKKSEKLIMQMQTCYLLRIQQYPANATYNSFRIPQIQVEL